MGDLWTIGGLNANVPHGEGTQFPYALLIIQLLVILLKKTYRLLDLVSDRQLEGIAEPSKNL